MTTFLGIDLGWYGKPTGVARLALCGSVLETLQVDRIEGAAAVIEWIEAAAGTDCVVAVDAPLVIRNASGIRLAERELNKEFRRYDAGCHAANLGRPFAANVTGFSARLEELGFGQGAFEAARAAGRFQIEVHPHAATIRLFGLEQIVKYKRGLRAERARELGRLRRLMVQRLPALDPPCLPRLPAVPRSGPLKPAEDQIDAVICAYIAAHWWHWGSARNMVYGDADTGSIVVPRAVPGAGHAG